MQPICQSTHLPSSPPTLPKPSVADISKGYSSVNKLGLLPSEVQASEFQEGKNVPSEKRDQLLDRHTKEKAELEDQQLHNCEETKPPRVPARPNPSHGATTVFSASLPVSSSEGMFADRTPAHYDSVEPPMHASTKDNHQQSGMEQYTVPADALALQAKRSVAHQTSVGSYEQPPDALFPLVQSLVAKKKISPDKQKNKVMVEASNIGQAYSSVFNTLPAGEREIVIALRPARVFSDTSPRDKHKNNAAAAAVEGGQKEEELVKRRDIKRVLSNRRSTKEEVELDPDKRRVFRMTSKKKKSGGGGGGEGEDQADGGGICKNLDSPSSSQEVERSELVAEATGGASVVQDHVGTGMVYAMVNMADRKKNRVTTDVVKCEGSGIPQHFVVPVLS